jgi:galactitol-specific phosphotransferase system IIB component
VVVGLVLQIMSELQELCASLDLAMFVEHMKVDASAAYLTWLTLIPSTRHIIPTLSCKRDL